MIKLRSPQESDAPRLSELFERCFGRPLDPGVWLWKYRRVPGAASSLVAEDERGRFVAHAGALCLPSRWAGGEGGIWQLADFMGMPQEGGLLPPVVAAGRRLLAQLPRPDDVPWIFGFPSPRHFKLGERVFGYRSVGHIEPLAGPLPSAGGESSRIEVGDHCGAWAGAVWKQSGVLGIERSTAFLNWRYHARPDRYYRFYRMRFSAGDGLAVFAFHGQEALAAELWLPGGGAGADGEEWVEALLAIASDLRRTGMKSWRFWPQPGPVPGDLLSRLELRPREGQFLGCCGPAGRKDLVELARDFYYVMGDYDMV